MKILPPTLRPQRRYLAFEVISEKDVSRDALLREIFPAASYLLGDLVSSQCEIRLLDFDYPFGILRCLRDSEELTRTVLCVISSIDGTPAFIRVLGVSGTIKAATEKYIEGQEAYDVHSHL
ncbi:ribonuclease P/MRP protein subunit POP5 [Methanohalophilus levihalophilus]|uniref:Rpp14/Pop5 family protein n=1 Tax=Methanohalophilus levihalophilus TaxID=1431282 RepID=UPI001AE753A6|nr:Rpp14/Pop5 family protein [Methanohalophilus levihalophilus]MBP2029408.1 ribonuclease P/MRP protein subunit POP5 [Methanohalophilus levihalophilus]